MIDSENINDVWVEILDALEREDCIMVFFTDKSAHMGYDRIVRLMNQEKGSVKWIRCFGGQNALDFQLVTELGHQICQDQEREYVIVSNDTGYDAAVRYWQQRGCSVSRIKGVECTKLAFRMKKQRQAEKNRESWEAHQAEETAMSEVLKVPESKEKDEKKPEKEKIRTVSDRPDENPADQKLDGVLNGTITDEKIVEEEVEKAVKLLFDPAFLGEDTLEENCEPEEDPESDLKRETQSESTDHDGKNDKKWNKKSQKELKKEKESQEELQEESQKELHREPKKNIRTKKKKKNSSAVLAKTLFDKVATPERKAQVESLTDTAKTALGAVLESASEIIAEQIAEKAVSKSSKNSKSVRSEAVFGNPETENKEEQENEYLEGYPELEDERDLNYDPDSDSDMDINMDSDMDENAGSGRDRESAQDPGQEVSSMKEESRKISGFETPKTHMVSEIQSETPKQKKARAEREAQKKEVSLETEISVSAKETDHEKEKSEEEEAQRMASYSSCQRSILRIFRASGSSDPHQDLRFFMDLCRTIKLSNMMLIHNVLEYQFGQAVGNSLYRYLKENPESREELSAGYNNNKKQREREYLNLILKRNQEDIQEETMEAVWKILSALPRKNLSGIHTALVKKFGQKDGSSYYAVICNHVRIIRSL